MACPPSSWMRILASASWRLAKRRGGEDLFLDDDRWTRSTWRTLRDSAGARTTTSARAMRRR
eukprot:15195869-Heterocapsa_arctica.AAC.1